MVSPTRKASPLSNAVSRPSHAGSFAVSAAAVPRETKTGTSVFLRNIASPFTWSMCSCVMMSASSSPGFMSNAASAAVSLRSETPTSISTAVPSETYRPQFPLDPLAML